MAKTLLCRVGWHRWRTEVNDSGEKYQTCRKCGKLDNRRPGPIGWMGG